MTFDRPLRPATGTSWVVSYGGKTIPRWRTAAILKIVISPYLTEKSSYFHDVIKKWKSCIGQTPSTRPLFQGRTGCGGRPSGWHDIVTCQRLVFIARQHSGARYWYSNSVRPSVRNVPVSDENGLTYRQFFSPYGSPIILVLPPSNIFTKFRQSHPIRGH